MSMIFLSVCRRGNSYIGFECCLSKKPVFESDVTKQSTLQLLVEDHRRQPLLHVNI